MPYEASSSRRPERLFPAEAYAISFLSQVRPEKRQMIYDQDFRPRIRTDAARRRIEQLIAPAPGPAVSRVQVSRGHPVSLEVSPAASICHPGRAAKASPT